MSLRAPPVMLAALTVLSSGLARAEGDLHETPIAPAPSSAECVRMYEQGQEHRNSGRLVAARAALQVCARDECADFIRHDCAAWYGELQDELPTLVFAARSGERDLTNVRIAIGQRVLAARIDGQAIELDPGEYDLDFVAPGMLPLTQHVLIARGERNRLLRVELRPEHPVSFAPPRLASPQTRSLLLPGLLVGLGTVGVAGFGALGALGLSSESKLEATCSPRCSAAEVSSVRAKYLLADVSLGVGIASLSLGAYFFFSGAGERNQRALPVDVQAGPSKVSAIYRGMF